MCRHILPTVKRSHAVNTCMINYLTSNIRFWNMKRIHRPSQRPWERHFTLHRPQQPVNTPQALKENQVFNNCEKKVPSKYCVWGNAFIGTIPKAVTALKRTFTGYSKIQKLFYLQLTCWIRERWRRANGAQNAWTNASHVYALYHWAVWYRTFGKKQYIINFAICVAKKWM